MAVEKVQFKNARGQLLTGRYQRSDLPEIGAAIFAHCFTCNSRVRAAQVVSRTLAEHGISTLRFDFTGLGESDGEFAESSFSTDLSDLRAAFEFMRSQGKAPGLLVGHSLGGAAVLAAAGSIPEIAAVATIGTPADPAHVKHLFSKDGCEIEQEGSAEVQIGPRKVTITQEFIRDLEAHASETYIGKLNRALLIFHSPQDELVEIENARRIYELAKHPKSFISLSGADHLLTDRNDAHYVGCVLAAWAQRYLSSEA